MCALNLDLQVGDKEREKDQEGNIQERMMAKKCGFFINKHSL
jgi:hypothetical protein